MDNITNINGKDSFAENVSNGDTAWHQKGTKVQGLMTIQEALEKGGQDFRVAKMPVVVAGKDTDWFATVRTDTMDTFGIVKGTYKVIQNDVAFDFFNPLLKDGQAIIETVGTLGQYGEKTFIMARMPESYTIGDTANKHLTYLLLTNDHSGNGNAFAMPTDVRVVCWNTMQYAVYVAKKAKVAMAKIRHSGDIKAKIKEAQNLLKLVQETTEFNRVFSEKLVSTPLTKELASTMLDNLLEIKTEFGKKVEDINSTMKINQKDLLLRLFEGGIGADMFPNTAYNYLNAVTEWTDHKKSVRGGDVLGSIFAGGNGFRVKQKAQEQLVSLMSN